MIWPVWHTGHDKSCSFGFFSVDVLFVVFFFPGLADVVDFFFGSSGGGAAVILPELSLSTYKTISPTIFFSSSRKSAARSIPQLESQLESRLESRRISWELIAGLIAGLIAASIAGSFKTDAHKLAA